MRVYYNPAINPSPTGDEEFNSIMEKYLNTFLELQKYKVMWRLRSIEEVLNKEDGVIRLTNEGDIKADGFSAETTALIYQLLN